MKEVKICKWSCKSEEVNQSEILKLGDTIKIDDVTYRLIMGKVTEGFLIETECGIRKYSGNPLPLSRQGDKWGCTLAILIKEYNIAQPWVVELQINRPY
jgi:hypothetical protein